jgi:HTH-type transcriptional regulator/antitoxin MqsA
MRDEVRFLPGATMIHPETGVVLSRRRRIETVEYLDLKRTIEVEAFWPDDDGDGVLLGADHAAMSAALNDMKAEHAARIRALSVKIRKAAGLTQKEASQLLTGSPNSFSKYERGEAQPSWPTFLLLKLIAADPSLIDKIKAA